jgi:hypothetical protein
MNEEEFGPAERRKALEDSRDREIKDTVKAIGAARSDLSEITIVHEYALYPSVKIPGGEFGYAVQRIKVSRTSFNASAADEDAEDGEDGVTYLDVRGYVYPLTKQGKVRARSNPWWSYLPREVAELFHPTMISRVP